MSAFRCIYIGCVLALVGTQCSLLGADEISVTTVPSDLTLQLKLKITDLAKEGDSRLLLFSTLNGYLYAVEQETGKTKWKIKDRAIITVPKEDSDALNTIFLPDPKDGSLYVITNTKERVKKLEFSIPELVTSSPCRSTDGILYTGKKKDTWFRIDPRTGDRQQILGWDILHGPTCPVQAPDAIYIGRTEYSLRMVDSKQSQRRWNVTFYDYTSVPMSKEDQARYEMVHFTSSSTGLLVTLDRRRGSITWQGAFDSPIVGVYLLDPDGLISIPFTSVSNQTLLHFIHHLGDDGKAPGSQMKLYPTLYIGEHPEGLYAMPSYVDQNMVTITSGDGRVLLLEGPYGKGHPPETIIEYPLPGQDYPLPHDAVMDTMTFQSVPSQTRIRSIVYLGHYDVPKYSNEKFLLPGQSISHRLITDESRTQEQQPPRRSDLLQETRIAWVQMSFSFVLTILTTVLAVHFCARQIWDRSETGTVETPDGCVRIGKISFDKGQLLGKGCEGTFVYRGEFEGRRVAVKRLLPECFDFADREVALLRESDAHPNVVRYFCTEQDPQFRYIALELCQATLCEYVTQRVRIQIDELEILQQATLGLAHLHSLNIVHRDIKPQNVLLSVTGPNGRVRAMISDFGLSKKLQLGKASLSKHSGLTGTDGWIAPEMLSEGESITCAVDLFSLGCLYYYVLSGGGHPFGDALHRQANILAGHWLMDAFRCTPEKVQVSMTLLTVMISPRAKDRPDCCAVLNHPIFWPTQAVLAFLQDVSDRVEKSPACDPVLIALEENSDFVVRGDWQHHIDQEVSSDLRKYRNYRGNSLRDLLRALRNKKHHYHELAKEAQRLLGDIPNEFAAYWTSRFPLLLAHTWIAMQLIRGEDNFRQYYPSFHFPKSALNYQITIDDRNIASPSKSRKIAIAAPQSHPTLRSIGASRNHGLYQLPPQSSSDFAGVGYGNRTQQIAGRRKNYMNRKNSTKARTPKDVGHLERPVWVLYHTENS